MPTYGTTQPGGVPTEVGPGENTTLFDGTETPVLNLASMPIARGPGASGEPNGMTFNCVGIPSGCTIDIQVSPVDTAGDYSTVYTIAPDANGNGWYTDNGFSKFYRAKLSAYTSGTMPTVTVQR